MEEFVETKSKIALCFTNASPMFGNYDYSNVKYTTSSNVGMLHFLKYLFYNHNN